MAGLDLGLAEDPSAICLLGRDPDGCSASEEDSAEGSDGEVTHTFAPASHGFRGGGGPTQACTDPPATDMTLHTGTLATDTPTRAIRSTHTRDTGKQTKGGQKHVVA